MLQHDRKADASRGRPQQSSSGDFAQQGGRVSARIDFLFSDEISSIPELKWLAVGIRREMTLRLLTRTGVQSPPHPRYLWPVSSRGMRIGRCQLTTCCKRGSLQLQPFAVFGDHSCWLPWQQLLWNSSWPALLMSYHIQCQNHLIPNMKRDHSWSGIS